MLLLAHHPFDVADNLSGQSQAARFVIALLMVRSRWWFAGSFRLYLRYTTFPPTTVMVAFAMSSDSGGSAVIS